MERSEKLTPAESTVYRSMVMKLACVAQNRVDIAEKVKCLIRHMKAPRCGHKIELKRLGRFLTKSKGCVLTYPRHLSYVSLQAELVKRGGVPFLGGLGGRADGIKLPFVDGTFVPRNEGCVPG